MRDEERRKENELSDTVMSKTNASLLTRRHSSSTHSLGERQNWVEGGWKRVWDEKENDRKRTENWGERERFVREKKKTKTVCAGKFFTETERETQSFRKKKRK